MYDETVPMYVGGCIIMWFPPYAGYVIWKGSTLVAVSDSN